MPLCREKQVSFVKKDQIFLTATAKVLMFQLKKNTTWKKIFDLYCSPERVSDVRERGENRTKKCVRALSSGSISSIWPALDVEIKLNRQPKANKPIKL